MNIKEVIEIAEKYLNDKKILFVKPGFVDRVEGELMEVVFLVPDALDPNTVVDPPDIRLWVNLKSKTATLVHQM